MKRLFILWSAMLTLLCLGCYDDKGNYSYHDINELDVEGIESLYACDVDDSLCITPVIHGTQYSDTSRFTYAWEIGGSEVGTSHDLRIIINMTPGYKYSRYIVTDKETNVKTYYEFAVNVSSSTAGDLIMVLSKYQGRAELSYLRLDKPANWAINYFQDRYGVSLGTEPQQLSICYTESSRNSPFVNAYGRVMVLADNVVNLIDKSTLALDSINPYLTVDAYLTLVSYPKPDIENYRSEFISSVINIWRYVTYGAQQTGHFIEISAGRIFTASSMAPSIWSTSYTYDRESPYGGYLAPFGYWDAMTNTPHDNNLQAGYDPGDFMVFDQTYGRFVICSAYGSVSSIEEDDVRAFPGYTLLWGSATNRPNDGSLAVVSNGSECRLLMFEDGTSTSGSSTKKLVAEVSGGSVINDQTSFYMMKYNDNLFFATGQAIYRYNILNISSRVSPRETDKVFDLSELGYDSNAVITDICVSRTEETLLVGVSRYGSDTEAMSEEIKGDLLRFNLDSGSGRIEYDAENSVQGISGIPVDVEIKYQTHYRDGVDVYGTKHDNI